MILTPQVKREARYMNASHYCPGFRFAGVAAGIKNTDARDLGLILSDGPATVAGVFTRNQVQASCVQLNKERILSGQSRAVIANSGNANCCNGEQGMTDSRSMTAGVAAELNLPEEQVLVASTGVIGQPLPLEKIEHALPVLIAAADENGLPAFAESIMTTDTVSKIVSRQIEVDGTPVTVTGVAKGSGMIRPDMATMLCFICSDVAAEPKLLQQLLSAGVNRSFNRITVDGDTSTNDMVLLMANGASGVSLDNQSRLEAFRVILDDVLVELAKMIVKDGEGATKLVEIRVNGAKTDEDARAVADTVAHSNLVKTAFFGEDANWGRIVAAVGRAHVPINPDRIDISFGPIRLLRNGRWCGAEAEESATRVLKAPSIDITIDLKLGNGSAKVWTCDFSIDYVKINADYRS
jgi:glutamate N-acetyltransferase/amino-acid N-acetyltransferase